MAWTRRGVLVSLGLALAGLASGQSISGQAMAVLRRRLGSSVSLFDLQLVSDGAARPWFEINAVAGNVHVMANSEIGLLRGVYAYLNASGIAQINWEGDRIAPPARWPELKVARSESFFRHRAYLNPCTYGYTTPFWDWPRWEREIDWMTLHGIDMPLAMEGQEYVWQKLWADAGLSAEELSNYFCGPAFLPWQRMGNIEGYGGPLPQRFIEKKCELQKRLLERMRALGMVPVLPAFAGYVPKAFAKRHPEARIHKMTPWGGFHETYWLDPTDPLFVTLARGFRDRYTAAFGPSDYYLADAFNEMRPPVQGMTARERDVALSRYGRALYDALAAAHPGAVLTMQGWLFGIDPEFWSQESVAAFLRDIPDDKLLVLDIANDTYPGVWERNKAFSGKPWIYGYIHDFGGNNPVFGDLAQVKDELAALPVRTDTGRLEGFGVFPEGLNTNSVIYDFMFDRAWPASGSSETVDAWLAKYLKSRYGKTDPALLSAWEALWRAVYHVPNWWPISYWKGSFGQYLFCKRPDQALAGFDKTLGDFNCLQTAVKALLTVSDNYSDSDLFRYDLVTVCAHYGTLCVDRNLLVMMHAFGVGDRVKAERAWKGVRQLALQIDGILSVLPWSLESWTSEARRYATTPVEEKIYVENAKLQITVWGGDAVLKDYASKAWAGLYRQFYLPRWHLYVKAQRAAKHGTFDQAALTAELVRWETTWAKNPRSYLVHRPDRLFDAVAALLVQCSGA